MGSLQKCIIICYTHKGSNTTPRLTRVEVPAKRFLDQFKLAGQDIDTDSKVMKYDTKRVAQFYVLTRQLEAKGLREILGPQEPAFTRKFDELIKTDNDDVKKAIRTQKDYIASQKKAWTWKKIRRWNRGRKLYFGKIQKMT